MFSNFKKHENTVSKQIEGNITKVVKRSVVATSWGRGGINRQNTGFSGYGKYADTIMVDTSHYTFV